MDGGTVWNVNVSSAINQCKDMGASNEEIVIDVVVCGELNNISPNGNSVANWKAARSISERYRSSDSLAAAVRAADGVTLRYYF